jgi:antitoxin (DNA-binding transcriptional repressor) of toxin-antitoxin stability system
MTVREIRQRWPEAEKALALEGEIIVTQDSVPVSKIVPYVPPAPKKGKVKKFNAAAHMRWLKELSKDDPPNLRSSSEILFEMRNKGNYGPPAGPPPPRE